jgi:hypothetical protein
MLPIGLFAVALTWHWITAEERAVQVAQQQESLEALTG